MLGDCMSNETAREKISVCYERLQTLDITPSVQNMEKLLQTLYDLRDAYNGLDQKGAEDGRPEDYSE